VHKGFFEYIKYIDNSIDLDNFTTTPVIICMIINNTVIITIDSSAYSSSLTIQTRFCYVLSIRCRHLKILEDAARSVIVSEDKMTFIIILRVKMYKYFFFLVETLNTLVTRHTQLYYINLERN